MVVRAEWIHIVPFVNGEADGFPFSECEENWQAKNIVVIRRPGWKTSRWTVMTLNPCSSELNTKYTTGEPTEV